ncbi:MAG: hypothetical protein ACOX7J_02985 [Bacillota bacterium]|jgi:hypothetical protein
MTDEMNTVDDVQQEVVDPASEEVSADEAQGYEENPEAPAEAAPAKQSHEDNQAFAGMRKRLEAAEMQLSEAQEQIASGQNTEKYIAEILREQYGFHGNLLEMADELRAAQTGQDVNDIRNARLAVEEEIRSRQEQEAAVKSIEDERDFYRNIAMEKLKTDILSEVKNSFPECKAESVDEFGIEFATLLQNGLSPVTAYAAVTAAQNAGKKPTPPEIGAVNNREAPDREFFTREEVAKMTKDEVHRNWGRIQKSRLKWS